MTWRAMADHCEACPFAGCDDCKYQITEGDAEEWRTLPGYEGLYEVSNIGRVRSYHVSPRYPNAPRFIGGGFNSHGYRQVHLQDAQGEKVTRPIHCLVMLAFVGPRPEGMEVRHLDGDPANPALWNLAYGTRSENALDRERHRPRTHCKRGHEFTPENTRTDPRRGNRGCRTCEALRASVRAKTSVADARKSKPLPTVCRNGHAYTPENTRIKVRKDRISRQCITCLRAQERRSTKGTTP